MYSKKAQSAMEYLMTYGWAILIILIAIGALFYLGVFSPSTPNVCQFNSPFMCIGGDVLANEEGATGDTLKFTIGVQAGISTPTVTAINLGGEDIKDNCGTLTLTAGSETTITCTAPAEPATDYYTSAGDKFSGTVDFSYEGSAGPHTVSGTFSGTVEAAAPTA